MVTAGRQDAEVSSRLAELIAALSLATDLGTGQPLEHALRTCLLSLELARRSGVPPEQFADVYYLALLRFVGCTADAAQTASLVGGDDIGFIRDMGAVVMGSRSEQVRQLVRSAGAELPLARRVGRVAAVLADPGGGQRTMTAHCEAAKLLSVRLEVGRGVTTALGMAFARWDGEGVPAGLAGEDIPLAVRIVIVARDIDQWMAMSDLETTVGIIRRRSGRAYDPQVAETFLRDPAGALSSLSAVDAWEATLDAEPAPYLWTGPDRLDGVLEAFAAFADLKSPWLRGHSAGVAELAAGAGQHAGLGHNEVVCLRRAGLVHDLGRVGVANAVWDHPGPLTTSAWERVRLHPYLTERILSRASALAPLARISSCHHERSDGSGYHRGARGAELTFLEELLAAADACQAMSQDRPHRPALTDDEVATALDAEVKAGRLQARAVDAVLTAAGHQRSPPTTSAPAGLTAREVEVLSLIARGRTNRQVATELVISNKTVNAHVEHIYRKAGVSTRAGAALFAMEHRLL